MSKYLELKENKDYTKIKEVSEIIKKGGIVVFPTETVYFFTVVSSGLTVTVNVVVFVTPAFIFLFEYAWC